MTECNEYVYLAPAFFYLHIVNAYEDKDHIVLDLCCYETSAMLKCMAMDILEVIILSIKRQRT